MAVDFVFPSNNDLKLVEQELMPRLQAARPIFRHFPITNEDSAIVSWEQLDNFIGLQQVRGIDGQPSRVKKTGAKRWMMQPGYYGEFMLIDEYEITTRRQFGSLATPTNIADLVRQAQDKLLQRRLDRIEWIVWTLLATGTFAVADGTSVLATDSYTTQTFAAGVTWATSATATPLADIRAVQLLSRGASVDFGPGAELWMNRTTSNQLLSNTNQADLGGRRGAGLSSINGPQQVNELLAMDDLPNIVVYDQGYFDDSNAFQLWIPNNKVIVIGRRTTGDAVGEYKMTRNATNPGAAPGPYTEVVDSADRGNPVPRQIAVHDGHNGGPAIYHPKAIVVMTV